MVRKHGVIMITVLMLVSSSAGPARATIPWKKLKGGHSLSAGQKKEVQQALETFKSYHGCTKSVADCLAARTNKTELAFRLAEYAVFLASKGLSRDAIGQVLKRRRQSALPKRKAKLALAQWPHIGRLNAPVIIVEFADFRCAHCAKVSPILEQLAKRYPKRVALVFKTFPLETHGPSLLTAHAALAAAAQGKFWPMIGLLFAHRDKHHPAGLRELATKVGLNLERFDAAMKDRGLLKPVEQAKIEGIRNHVRRTPTIFVNGKRYRLRKDAMHFKERIEEELLLLGK